MFGLGKKTTTLPETIIQEGLKPEIINFGFNPSVLIFQNENTKIEAIEIENEGVILIISENKEKTSIYVPNSKIELILSEEDPHGNRWIMGRKLVKLK
jgi:hypothetical protein